MPESEFPPRLSTAQSRTPPKSQIHRTLASSSEIIIYKVHIHIYIIMYIYIHTLMCIYIYIYIHTYITSSSNRPHVRGLLLRLPTLSGRAHMCVYIYIYM